MMTTIKIEEIWKSCTSVKLKSCIDSKGYCVHKKMVICCKNCNSKYCESRCTPIDASNEVGISKEIADFAIEFDHKSKWFSDKNMDIYIRRSKHIINKGLVSCLDLANINVIESMRGKGLTTSLINSLIPICKKLNLTIYVESVLNGQWGLHLVKMGFGVVESEYPYSYYLTPEMMKVEGEIQ